MADEYVNSTDKATWANEAAKTLGRGYQTLIPLFAEGGDALRKQTDAIDDSLIATEDAIKASRAYEVGLDNLGDSVTGLKYAIGNELIPVLTDGTDSLNGFIGKLTKRIQTGSQVEMLVKIGIISEEEYGDAIGRNQKIQDAYNELILAHAGALQYSGQVEREEAIRRGKLNEITAEAIEAEEELAKKTWDTSMAQAAATRESDKLNQAYDDMNAAIDGKLGPSLEDFNQKQGDLSAKMEEVQGKIDELNGKEYLTDAQKEDLANLQGDYDELKNQYGENATEHDRATKEIMFDILKQRAAIGGLSKDE